MIFLKNIKNAKYTESRLLKTGMRFFILPVVFLLSFTQAAFAEKITRKQLKAMELSPSSQTIFVQQDLSFVLTLPGVSPENVQVSLAKLPENVQFLFSRRSDFIDQDRDTGTRIEFWFSFLKSGEITIPPLNVTISGYRYSIPFETVNVTENPETVAPKMTIEFTRGAEPEKDGSYTVIAGQSVFFTVNLKYILQIAKFDWDLQKNSIFKEIKRYAITEGKPRGREFFNDEVPVATFEWRPLIPGEWTLPEIKIIAARYNGSRVEVEMPHVRINVIASETDEKNSTSAVESGNTNNDENDDVFAYAFTEDYNEVEPDVNKSLNKEQCKVLADLRSQERHSLPFSKKRTERFAYEKSFGISVDTPEPSLVLFYICICAGIVFAVLTVLLIFFKKKLFILFLSLLCVVILLCIASSSKLNSSYGIFTGGGLSPIPEESAIVPQQDNGGVRVRILEKTSKWSYVVFNNTGGWVLNDSIFLIK